VLEAELAGPLAAWGRRFFASLDGRLERLAAAEALGRLEIEARLVEPVARLEATLGRLASQGSRDG
jgi:hypothetical protein